MVVQGSTTAASSVCFIRFIAVSVYAFSPANKLHKSTPLHCNGQTDGQTDRRDAGGDITSSTVQMDPIDGTT